MRQQFSALNKHWKTPVPDIKKTVTAKSNRWSWIGSWTYKGHYWDNQWNSDEVCGLDGHIGSLSTFWYWQIYCGHGGECPCFQKRHTEVSRGDGHQICYWFWNDSEKKYFRLHRHTRANVVKVGNLGEE